jgi:hypothetical protein
VDGGGNVYFNDNGNNQVKEWTASTGQVQVLVPASRLSPDYSLSGLALDLGGNLFVDDGTAIYELPHAWVGPANLSEPSTAGSDVLLPVVPASVSPGTPVSNQSWLTITGTAGGIVSFSFMANPTASARTAQIALLGATLTVTQSASSPASISATGGNNQSAMPGAAFARPLTALVTNALGNPLSGITVTFAAPASGASATFSPGSIVQTNSAGVASVVATANGSVGSFTATASVGGLASMANFALSNSLFSPCDVNQSGSATVADVQATINEALGAAPPVTDLNGDGKVNVADVQIVIDAVLFGVCTGS